MGAHSPASAGLDAFEAVALKRLVRGLASVTRHAHRARGGHLGRAPHTHSGAAGYLPGPQVLAHQQRRMTTYIGGRSAQHKGSAGHPWHG